MKNKKFKARIVTEMVFTIFILIFLISSVDSEITTNIQEYEGCEHRWFCSNWNPPECPENGIQKRYCTNAGTCPDNYRSPEETRNCIAERPSQLFDIILELESYEFPASGELVAWIRFESFGTESTPVNLTYTVYDKDNNPFFIKHDNVTVETERFVAQKFPALRLKPGYYSLVLETEYGGGVEDVFIKEFRVRRESATEFISIGFVFIALLLLIVFLHIINVKGARKKNGK